MSSLDIFTMALRNLYKRKLRTILTTLGVVIGTASIVVFISLGLAINEGQAERVARWGDIRSITVYSPNNYYYEDYNVDNIKLDEAAILKFKEMAGVTTATGFIDVSLTIVSGKYESWAQLRGIDPEAMHLLDFDLAEGRLLEVGDKLNLVFGSDAPYNFYNTSSSGGRMYYGYYFDDDMDRPPPDVDVMTARMQMSYDWSFGASQNSMREMTTKPYTVKGVGILETKDYNTNNYIYINIKEAEKIRQAKNNYENANSNWGGSSRRYTDADYSQAIVKCDTIEAVREVESKIKELGYDTFSATQQLDYMRETTASLQALLGAVGIVSLVVAAIGIANTMIMAIYERTREIGVMKVIGAAIRDIRKLFLVEASMIGFLGGIFGIGFSLAISHVLNTVGISFFDMMGGGSKISSVPPWLCLVALAFSSFIGLLSGYFPARRAMKISALSAIRTD